MSTGLTLEEIGRIGQELYDREIKARVEPSLNGKYLVLDVVTGEYEIDDDDPEASDRLLARLPEAELYGVRIGYSAAYRIGWHPTAENP